MTEFCAHNVCFRSFSDNDLLQISQIEEISITPPWSYKALCDFAVYETSRILVASQDEKVLGYITYSQVLDEFQIANVAVSPDFRRLGIAKELLNTLKENAKSNDISIITLEVRASNNAAINLYEKCGYKECGRRKNYYKQPTEDAILMNLIL